MRGFVVGGTRSGVGKTVASLAVMTALMREGYSVQPAKAGPDYIDPGHHEDVAGTPSRSLDVWMQGGDGVRRNYHRGEGDVCVVEGVMGLYDGSVTTTAELAETLDLPVVLVVDAKAGMQSVAATAHGFDSYADEAGVEVDVAGVVAQRCHGGRHERGVREALPDGLELYGRIPPLPGLEVPDRHLGLETADESPVDAEALERASEHVDAEALVDDARTPPKPSGGMEEVSERREKVVAVASDPAFCFSYPESIERLRRAASVETFSPVHGDALPRCDGVYLPGGYPELYAEELCSSPTLDELRSRAEDGVPIYGECGGLMALSQRLTTVDGDSYGMAGVLPAEVEMHDRRQALDHVELEATADVATASEGDRLRGHEFHYSSCTVDDDASFAFDVRRGEGVDGLHDGVVEYSTVASYSHLHAASGAFDRLVEEA